MKVGARTRMTLVVMLGVVAGFGFISLPSILAVPSPTSPTTTTGSNSTTTNPSAYNGHGTIWAANSTTTTLSITNATKTRASAQTTITPDAVSVLISLIVVPALGLSWVATVLVSSRARKDLAKVSEDESSQEGSTQP